MSFVHLRIHSEYSVVDGTLRVDAAAAAARDDGQGALALTDLNNLFGAIKFYKACRSAGVKPLIGADLWMEPWPASGDKAPSRLLVLVQDRAGYLNLCELLARAWTRNAQRTQAWVKWESLEELGQGLIVLSGADLGAMGVALLAGDLARARGVAQWLHERFAGRFYVELQRAGLPHHEAHVRAAVPLAAELGLPVVATHPVQFLEPDDFDAHEARVCVAEGELLSNPRRVRRFSREQYFQRRDDMAARFADVPSALANTVEIARRCNLILTLGEPQLPDFPTPDGTPIAEYFRKTSRDGLAQRLQHLFPNPAERERERPRYAERLEFEIATIEKMGFPGYFLIVADFITWAKAQRLSGRPRARVRRRLAGGLCAVDHRPRPAALQAAVRALPEPRARLDAGLRHRLLPGQPRTCHRLRQGQVRARGGQPDRHLRHDGGQGRAARRRPRARHGLRPCRQHRQADPGAAGQDRDAGQPPAEPDPGVIYARLEAPELEQREAAEEEVAELLTLAMRVEGIVRNIGMHAGGVLIAPGKITDFCPLYQQPGSDSAVSQFDKDDVEAIGLVKFDFLGLATLTILELAQQLHRRAPPGAPGLPLRDLTLDDPKVYKLFSDSLTESVFQFESRGMQGMLREARPSRFEDLIALVAMYRPGPMENIPTFCARKNGKESVVYPHPLLETVLGETYGVMVYQEQVMQAAQLLGGYSLGGADLLRRAMGKKKAEEMAKHRAIFRDGAAAKGISAAKADEVFDLMEKFAGYGFNKSHAAAYALLAYHTAWLKVHCTAEFYAANMTIEQDNTDKLKVLLNDAKLFNVEIEAPDVNRGVSRFEPVSDRAGPLRPGGDQGHRRGRDRRHRRRARRPGRARGQGQRAVPQPVRLLRPRRSPARQQAGGRSADQGRRLRRGACRPRRAAGQRRPGLRLGRHAGGQRAAGRPVRLRRLACRQPPGAGAGADRPVDAARAADAGEGRARALPVRASVRRGGARGAALLPPRDRRPGRRARAAVGGRHRRRPARRQRPARPAGDLPARRRQRVDRGRGARGAARGAPRPAGATTNC